MGVIKNTNVRRFTLFSLTFNCNSCQKPRLYLGLHLMREVDKGSGLRELKV